jgi:lipopolysaccharide biosynthesis regulator YciM
MTLMTFLLLIIFFLSFFIYFSNLNPQTVTIYYLAGESFSASAAFIVIGALLIGLFLGSMAYGYGMLSTRMRDWRKDRHYKKTREISAMYREGVGRLLSGDLKKARVLLQKTLDKDPKRVDTQIAMATLCLQEGQSEEALKWLNRARELEPQSLEVLFKLAATLEDLGRDDEAEQIYKEILNVDKDNRKAIRGLRDLAMKTERWPEALELQKRLLKAMQGSPRIADEKKKLLYIKYEVAHQQLETGEIDTAKSEFNDVISQDPEFVPARVSLGDALHQQGKIEEAARIWQDGYRRLHKGIFLARLEDLYLEAEDPATLLNFYRNAMSQDANDVILRLYYAKLCLRLEMVDEAGEQIFAIESSGSEHPLVHFLAAEVHRRRKRTDEALEEYRMAMGMGGRMEVSYECEACGETFGEWLSRCRECGAWGTLGLSGRSDLANVKPVEMREIYHGEQ